MPDDFDLMGKNWEDIPEQAEAQDAFYKPPVGVYLGVFGRLTPKFVDINGKTCNMGEPGSRFHHATVPLWFIEYHGTQQEPKKETILGMDLKIPDRPTRELYYPSYISWEESDQWKNIQMFQNFEIKGVPNSQVVIANPAKPGKIVRFKSLQLYYGKIIHFAILHSDRGNAFIDSKGFPMKVVGNGFPAERMESFEAEINAKVQQERAEREQANASRDTEYKPPEEFDENSDSLDDFMS